MKTNKNNLFIHRDEAKMSGVPGYKEWWETQMKITERVSSFLRKLIEKYKVTKSSIYTTGMMSNKTLDKYLDVGEGSFDVGEGKCLSQEAIDHMAVIIVLVEPVINIQEERKHLLHKKGGMQGAILLDKKKDLETLRKEFKEAFGSMAQTLIYNDKGIESVEKLNEYYHHIFSNLKK